MNLKSLIPSTIARKSSLTVAKLAQNSPKIFFVGGVAGMVGTAVLASRATLKVDTVITEAQVKLSEIKKMQHSTYSEEDRIKDRVIVISRSLIAITKLYAPAIVLGGLSIAMLTKSHNMLTKRNAALAAAYVAVERGFKEYRERVVDELGEEQDLKFSRGLKKTEHLTVSENGKSHSETVTSPTAHTVYGRLFNEWNPNFQKVPEYNAIFLWGLQNMLNDRLKAKGYLFLNDVYDELGIERSEAGCVVGWLRDGDGDGFVDFGIFRDHLSMFDYVTGREGEIFLDFNVDGIIYDKFTRIK